MPRRAKSDESIYAKIAVPRSVKAAVDLKLMDPLRGKPRYGNWSRLVTSLLREWLEREER